MLSYSTVVALRNNLWTPVVVGCKLAANKKKLEPPPNYSSLLPGTAEGGTTVEKRETV